MPGIRVDPGLPAGGRADRTTIRSGLYTPVGVGPSVDDTLRQTPMGRVWQRRRALSAWQVIQREFESRHVEAFVCWQAFQTLVGIPAYVVYLATTAVPAFTTDAGTRSAVSAGWVGWPEDILDATAHIRRGEADPDFRWVLVATPSLVDGTRGPAGHHTVKVISPQSHVPPADPQRPAPGWAQHRMPIPGLYQAARTHPGGSITGAPGRNAAQVLLADLGTSIEEVVARGR